MRDLTRYPGRLGYCGAMDEQPPKNSSPALTRSAVEEAMQGGEQLDIADLARARSEDMLGVLVNAANREGTVDKEGKLLEDLPTWPVAISAAKTVIEIGHGRVATQEAEKQEVGLHITINQLFGGEATEKVIEPGELGAAIAKTIEISGAKVNLAEDLVEIVPVLSEPPSE